MLRIISGSARGRRLKTPPGLSTRPVTARIRESLFSIWGMLMPEAAFLDLFAGSGSMGIEALSRGARQALFVDNDPRAVQVIGDNLETCRLAGQGRILRSDVLRSIEKCFHNHELFDIIYIDPPFARGELFVQVLDALDEFPLLAEGGTIVIRSRRKMSMPDETRLYTRNRHDKYGESEVHHYCAR